MSILKHFGLLLLLLSLLTISSFVSSDNSEFKPTHEWQEIKEGQKIPKGLHVRINLETGKKEAKLIEDFDNLKHKSLIPISVEDDKEYPTDEVSLKEALKKIKGDDPQSPPNQDHGFRSYEELKITLEDLNLAPKKDSELIADLLDDFINQMKKKDDFNLEKVLIIIEDLDYLAHQIDNALDFVRQDGFNKIIYRNFNETEPEIKQMTLKLFGSLCQNNGKVQIHCLESGCLSKLLRLLAIESNEIVKSAGISALGSLIRRFPLAQKSFIDQGGIAVLNTLLENDIISIQVKIATLISDLLVENDEGRENRNDSVSKQYKDVNLQGLLLQNNWCDRVNKMLMSIVLLNIDDHDSIEKCLSAMKTVKGYCIDRFDSGLLNELQGRYKVLSQLEIQSNEEFDNHDYYDSIYQIISDILKSDKTVRTEL